MAFVNIVISRCPVYKYWLYSLLIFQVKVLQIFRGYLSKLRKTTSVDPKYHRNWGAGEMEGRKEGGRHAAGSR
jgi:hypothetical protein